MQGPPGAKWLEAAKSRSFLKNYSCGRHGHRLGAEGLGRKPRKADENAGWSLDKETAGQKRRATSC